MRKPFHTFIQGNPECQNNVFYTGVLNAPMKKLLLKNVEDLLERMKGTSAPYEEAFETSVHLLNSLNDFATEKKTSGTPKVLFQLKKDTAACHLQMGVPLDSTESDYIKNHLMESKDANEKKTSASVPAAIEQLIFQMKRNENFSWKIEKQKDNSWFLTAQISISHE